MTVCRETLSGNRVYIRPITYDDTDYIVQWRNSEHVRNNFIWRGELTEKMQNDWLKEMVNTGLVHQFIVCGQKDDEPVGSVYLQHFDDANHSAESGIFLGKINGGV